MHRACDSGIKSHVGAQLLLSDERCDLNLQDKNGNTAILKAMRYVEFADDAHAKIIEMFLNHQNFDIRTKNNRGDGLLHTACRSDLESHHGVTLVIDHHKCDVNQLNERAALHCSLQRQMLYMKVIHFTK